MTAYSQPLHPDLARDHATHGAAPHTAVGSHADHGHADIGFVKKYIFSIDHKTIGLQFLFVGLAFFVLGGLLAMIVRWQLAYPDNPQAGIHGKALPILGALMGWKDGMIPPDFYTMSFSMHGTIMIFFVIIPLLVGTFGNYLIPLKIGAPDMAFPFLNGMAFWLAVPAGAIIVASFFLQGGSGGAGWTVYPPLSTLQQNEGKFPAYVPPAGAWDGFVQRLRVHETGADLGIDAAHNDVEPKFEGGVYQSRYLGDPEKIGRAAALVVDDSRGTKGAYADMTLVSQDARGATVKLKDGTALALTLTPDPAAPGTGAVSVKAGAAGDETQSKVLLDRISKKLHEKSNDARDRWGWQSSWQAAPLLINYFALFMALLYLCAYYVRLGSRPLNIAVSIVLCLIGGFFLLHAVQRVAFDGQGAWFLSITILGFSSIMGAVNYLTTIVKLRCPGMTMFRLPLSVWSLFITSILVLLATPVLASALTMNLLDHHRLTSFFLPFNWINSNQLAGGYAGAGGAGVAGGGYPILHQHLFWFYSHPAVYIMIVPAMGMVSDIIAVFARKPIFGYRPMVYAMAGIAFLGFIVWAHHMFQSGMNPTLGTTFAISTMFIAVPSAIKTFNWLGTLWGGNIRFATPMLHAVAFVAMFVIGGLSGIFMASTAVDVHIHDTYFIVAHIHYVLFGGSMFGIFAALTFWYPKMFGRMMNERVGKLHFWLTFVFFNLTFFPMHILGIGGMARRIADPTQYDTFRHFLGMNRFITHSAFALGLSQLLFVVNFIGAWVWGARAPANPWDATTLEWNDAPSPPPHGNFPLTPIVHHGPYEYSTPLVKEDWLAQTRPLDGGDQFSPVTH